MFRAAAVTICVLGMAGESLGKGCSRAQDEQKGFPVVEGGQPLGALPEVLAFQRHSRCCDCAFLFFDSLRQLRYRLRVFDWETGRERIHEFATLEKFEGRMLDILGQFFAATRIVDRYRRELEWPTFWVAVGEVRAKIEYLRKEIRQALRPDQSEAQAQPFRSRLAYAVFRTVQFWKARRHESKTCQDALKAAGSIARKAWEEFDMYEAGLEDLCAQAEGQLGAARQELESALSRRPR